MSAQADADFDAIVVGSGITGGWVAKELCERGLKVLVLERGRNLDHPSAEYTDFEAPWELEYRGMVPDYLAENDRYEMLRRKQHIYRNEHRQFFVDDAEHPYSFPEDRPFMWTRGYQLGGRSLTWARQCYRWSQKDFDANRKDGHGSPWPIGYDDLAPWYSKVEAFAGISGNADGIDSLPDGEFLKP